MSFGIRNVRDRSLPRSVRRDGRYVAVEVKARQTFYDADLRGLRAIRDLDGLERRILVFLGERDMQTRDGIQIMTVRSWLEAIESGTLFTERQ